MTNFNELSIHHDMMKAIDKMGFENATKVQAKTIPLIRTGIDILAQSQTGTGKTMAFSIPAVENVDGDMSGVQVLILSPTRELAQQCGDEVRKLTQYMSHIKTADIYGGADYNSQFRALKKANFVIGTPGRIIDHINRKTLKLDNLKTVILDEADEMLNMGFKEDIELILEGAPKERQTLLFSATIPKGILEIAKEFQNNPTRVDLAQSGVTLKEIKQLYVDMPKHQKTNVLKLLMLYYRPQRCIVFANTKSMVDELTQTLCDAGLSASGIHGDMKQRQRTTVMGDFKKGRTEILVATDVAARGIDVSDIDYVINFDIPKMAEYYVHRIGRTGRAGRSGTAITLCCGRQQVVAVKTLAKKSSANIEEVPIPTPDDIRQKELESNIEKVSQILSDADNKYSKNKVLVDRLVERGYLPEQIATVLAGLAFEHTIKGLEDLPFIKIAKEKGKKGKSGSKNESFGGSFNNIVLSIGSSSRCSANHIVGAVTERTGMSSKHIGKITIQEDFSVVAVPADMLHDIMDDLKGIKICGKPVSASVSGDSFKDKKKKDSKKYQNNKKTQKQRNRGRANGSSDNSGARYAKRRKKK